MLKHKRLFSMLIALAMILSLLPVMASAATITGGTVLYLTPNSNWKVDNARFAAYFFGNGDAWASATAVEGETDLYQVTVPSGNWTNVIFCRMNPSTTANNWNNRWNQTSDLTYDGTKNHYTVKAGTWDKGGGTWSTYTPPVIETEPTIPETETAAPTEPSVTIPARDITIHYRNIHLWNTINAHSWIPEGLSITEWPGEECFSDESATNWFTLQLTDIESETIGILFNNGAGMQTADLIISDIPEENAEYWIDETVKAEDGVVQIQTTAPADTWPDGFIDADPTITPVYLKPNANWRGSNARFALHCFNDNSGAWFDMVDSDEDGIYEGCVPEIYSTIIFCRMNPGTTENNWDNKWNQTADLTVPTDDKNCYFITEDSWDQGTWDVLPPPLETADCTVTVHFQNTLNWESVNGYAWTNTWPASYPAEVWPGTALVEENGWYTLTFEANYVVGDGAYVIFNTVTGTNEEGFPTYAQTTDLKIECDGMESVEKWVVPTGEQTDYLSYSCQILDSQPAERTPVAEIYDVGSFYTFEDAYAAADPGAGHSICLLADVTVNDLVVDKEMYLDLNGFNATINAASAEATIYVQDSATVNSDACGKLIVTGAEYASLGGYLMLPEDEGHSFHCYDLSITHISLDAANDALGFKATLDGNARVQAAVTGYGFTMGVTVFKDYTAQVEPGQFDGQFTLRLNGIMAAKGGQMDIFSTAFVMVGDQQIFSNQESTNMRTTVETVDQQWNTAGYSDAQKAAVKALVDAYYEETSNWNLPNINDSIIDIPIR